VYQTNSDDNATVLYFEQDVIFTIVPHRDRHQTQALCLSRMQVILQHKLLLLPFYGLLSGTTQVSQYQKDKPFWIVLKQTWWNGSGISWIMWKSFALCATHCITQFFYRPDALPATQPTVLKALKARLQYKVTVKNPRWQYDNDVLWAGDGI